MGSWMHLLVHVVVFDTQQMLEPNIPLRFRSRGYRIH